MNITLGMVGRTLRVAVLVTLAVAAYGQSNCVTTPLDLAAPIDAVMLGDTGSCQIQNLLPAATLFQMSSLFFPLYAQKFTATIPEGGRVLRITLASGAFNPVILILDSKGNFLGSSGGSTTEPAQMLAGLPAGAVTVVAASAGAGGNFTITPTVEAFRTCTPQDFTLGGNDVATLNGTLSETSCRFLDFRQPSADVKPIDLYKLSLPAFTLVAIGMESNAFNPILYLVDTATNKVVASNDDISRVNLSSLLQMGIPKGEYLLVAGSTISLIGAYAIESLSAAPVACAPDLTLSLPGTATGSLTANDCQYWEFVPYSSDDTILKPYALEVPSKGLVQIDMTSSQFDTYLVLLNQDLTPVAEDDNGSGSANARLALTLNPGKYIVLANAAFSGSGGNYTLGASIQDPRTCPVGFSTLGDTANGQMGTGDCRIRDMTVGVSSDRFARQYRVEVPEGGGVLSMDATSTQFLPGIALLSTEGQLLSANGDQVAAGTYRLQVPVTAGEYNVMVYSSTSNNAVGNFTLKPTLIQ
ncbi:MAG: hypothetical protein HY820_14895 [Acidobacteria bacterium]|nr:hypothetical protein [Acidobacteriota bacterium]